MKRVSGRIWLGCCLVMTTGCDGLLPQDAQPTNVTVTFINDGADSSVELSFFSNADASVSLEDLTNATVSEQLAFSLDANESFQFVRACADFQAALVDRALLIVETGTAATASTPVLVDGMDFACGNFITFRLASQGPEDLQVAVSIGDTNPLSVATNASKRAGTTEGKAAGNGAAGDASGTANTDGKASAGAAGETAHANTNSNATPD